MIFTVRNKTDTQNSQGCLQQKNYVKMASWSSFIWMHFCIQRASNKNRVTERNRWPVSYHSWSDDLCGLNLFIYSHICKKVTFLMLAAAILCIMYILYTQYILLPMYNTRAPGIYAVIMGSPTTIKVMPDPFQGQGAKWLMSNTAAQERVKRGSVLQLPCSLAWRHDRSARVLRGKDVSL